MRRARYVAQLSKDDLFWQLAIHLGFVASGVLLAVMDKLSAGRDA